MSHKKLSCDEKKLSIASNKCKSGGCQALQNACNFTGVRADLSLTANSGSPLLTMTGLNGLLTNSLTCDTNCHGNKIAKDYNKIQVNEVFVLVGDPSVQTTMPILKIVQNGGGVFQALLENSIGATIGTSFTVNMTNQSIPCSGSITGVIVQ